MSMLTRKKEVLQEVISLGTDEFDDIASGDIAFIHDRILQHIKNYGIDITKYYRFDLKVNHVDPYDDTEDCRYYIGILGAREETEVEKIAREQKEIKAKEKERIKRLAKREKAAKYKAAQEERERILYNKLKEKFDV